VFTNIRGTFRCIRCGRDSTTAIQTYLFTADRVTAGREYGVGDTVEISGLDEFCALYPWPDDETLAVVMGDWDCLHCSLSWQFAKATFRVARDSPRLVGRIEAVSGFVPLTVEGFSRVHFVEPDMAEHSGFWASGQAYDWGKGLDDWSKAPVAVRCDRMVAGFREWCRDVAGVTLDP
jgi:hypothetical protein